MYTFTHEGFTLTYWLENGHLTDKLYLREINKEEIEIPVAPLLALLDHIKHLAPRPTYSKGKTEALMARFPAWKEELSRATAFMENDDEHSAAYYEDESDDDLLMGAFVFEDTPQGFEFWIEKVKELQEVSDE